MIDFDIKAITKILLAPTADFDSPLTFYYDETNNIRKFYVRETDFNYSYNGNFVLGGLVYEGTQPDITSLFSELNLQNNIQEVKLKHIAKGGFLNCLKSEKLNYFLKYLYKSNLYIHYSSLNILYWSIVDIVDSAIMNSEMAMELGLEFSNRLKNDLYRLVKLEIDSMIELFYTFEYPNIKKESIIEFIEELTSIFDDYIETEEFRFGLESLRQILKEAKNKNNLPFVMDEKDYVLIQDFSQFYLRPIYLFKNQSHIFDNEVYISEILNNKEEIRNFLFVDSQSDLFIQASDIFVGLMGKFTQYINTISINKIESDLITLSEKQTNNIDLFLRLIIKSHNKNPAFLYSIDSEETKKKMSLIYTIRKNITK